MILSLEYDLNREVNNGRGPVDYIVSIRVRDGTLVESKLARNRILRRNLENQLPIYQNASNSKYGIVVIVFYTLDEKKE